MRMHVSESDHIRYISAILICLIMASVLLLPISACAKSTGKTVQAGEYESSSEMMDAAGHRSDYDSSDSAKVTLGAFIRQNPVLVGAVLVAILALIIIIIVQNRFIVARREADESRHKVEDLNRQVYVDALTHVRNKAAYAEWEEKINEAIRKGEQGSFAVVVCDINNLKAVNDQYGHKEGDVCIQNACSRICNIFSHSPVFRVGGDEFVVFLSGVDFYQRKELMTQINAIPKDPSKIRIGETISAGMAEYRKDQHASLLSVFEEADKAMYARKQHLKAHGLPEDRRHGLYPETVSGY